MAGCRGVRLTRLALWAVLAGVDVQRIPRDRESTPPDTSGRRRRQRSLRISPLGPGRASGRAGVAGSLFGAQLVIAAQELAYVPAAHLHYRFLGWIR